MKIDGMKPVRRYGTFTILDSEGKPHDLKVSSLPLSFELMLDEEIPDPAPPMKVVGTNKDGPIRVVDEGNPAYVRQMARCQRAKNAMVVAWALRDEPKVTFESKGEGIEYWLGVASELQEFGWTGPDFNRLKNVVLEVTAVSKEELDRARALFHEAEEARGSSTPSSA